MNTVEIEEAVSELASEPFDAAEFPFHFLAAFGMKEVTIKRLRSGSSNAPDVAGGVLQRNNIHLAVAPEGDGTIAIRRGKTDQEGQGAVCFLAPDTMRDLRAWLDAAAIKDGLLFRAVNKASRAGGALDAGQVARIFKEMAEAAGIGPEHVRRVSGHSSRVGAAQDMVRHGVELPAVMQAGRWRTAERINGAALILSY